MNTPISTGFIKFPDLDKHVVVTIREKEPGTHYYREIRIKRAQRKRGLDITYRDWQGHQFPLYIDPVRCTAMSVGAADSMKDDSRIAGVVFEEVKALMHKTSCF